ncbi:MAG: gamma-glutamylcyclotransferase family protein [Beijerinckiaceae bacterium]|nr:gamma-glutamylcyclotransferase family protein [Beijerinckiaceae bacterium]
MPLYFAYGSNMDVEAMRTRAPASRPLGAARLPRSRFIIMEGGYASFLRDPQRSVHGVLWDLALADVRSLDRYEGVASGLYKKIQQPVLREGGGSARALIYVGASTARGEPRAGYMESVLAAARAWSFPDAYMRELAACAPRVAAGAAPVWRAPDGSPQTAATPERSGPAAKVRPRFATPFDRT